jgi:hypothetical protein
MSRYVAFKAPNGLMVCENKFEVEMEIHVFLINCKTCNHCDASSLVCASIRNDDYCDFMSNNIEACKNNAIKGGVMNNKKFKGLHRCCDFNMTDTSHSRDHLSILHNQFKKSI